MQMATFGFIGCGNMGGALAEAVAKAGFNKSIWLANRTPKKAEDLAQKLSANSGDNITVAKSSDFLFLGVKPGIIPQVISEIMPHINANTVIVSMAAGVSIEKIKKAASAEIPVIRIMPNTPVSVGCGTVLYCSSNVAEKQIADFSAALKCAGELVEIEEKLIDAASAVSGCGPAYVYMFIEALADGAVECGLQRELSIKLAASTLSGAAQMVLKSGKHPEKLKDDVCSPSGSTIAGVHALEKGNFRNSVMDCINAAYLRTKELS